MVIPAAKKITERFKIPWQVIVAQAVLETGWGRYISKDRKTNRDSKNLFNIKGKGPAGSVEVLTTEYYGGRPRKVVDRFRAYNTYEESFEDHAALLTQNKRYAPCMEVVDDPEEFARRLQACGYATDPKYAAKLISIMKRFA